MMISPLMILPLMIPTSLYIFVKSHLLKYVFYKIWLLWKFHNGPLGCAWAAVETKSEWFLYPSFVVRITMLFVVEINLYVLCISCAYFLWFLGPSKNPMKISWLYSLPCNSTTVLTCYVLFWSHFLFRLQLNDIYMKVGLQVEWVKWVLGFILC